MNRLIEIRSYKLKPGSGSRFHQLVANQSIPLLDELGMEVVAYGQSLHDPDSYYLIRAYNDLDHLNSSQEAFYSTDAWRKGPREAIIELIESDSNAVLWLSQEAIEEIRNSKGQVQTT
jgi:quinol monooxygenase YgiN